MLQLQSLRKGALAYERVVTAYDEMVKLVKANPDFVGYPRTLRKKLQELEDWKQVEANVISFQFLSWGEDANLVGIEERPSFLQYMKEIRTYADPSSSLYDKPTAIYMRSVNPELTSFFEETMVLWNQAEQLSQDRTGNVKWWRTSAKTGDMDPGDVDPAANVRSWFLNGVHHYYSQIEDDTARVGAQTFAERILTPLLEGWDFDDPIMLEMEIPQLSTDLEEEADTVEPQAERTG